MVLGGAVTCLGALGRWPAPFGSLIGEVGDCGGCSDAIVNKSKLHKEVREEIQRMRGGREALWKRVW